MISMIDVHLRALDGSTRQSFRGSGNIALESFLSDALVDEAFKVRVNLVGRTHFRAEFEECVVEAFVPVSDAPTLPSEAYLALLSLWSQHVFKRLHRSSEKQNNRAYSAVCVAENVVLNIPPMIDDRTADRAVDSYRHERYDDLLFPETLCDSLKDCITLYSLPQCLAESISRCTGIIFCGPRGTGWLTFSSLL
jgi:hypothetical protein